MTSNDAGKVNEEPLGRRLKFERHPTKNIPGFDANLGRVNVILGTNGSGKSRLLSKVKDLIALNDGSLGPDLVRRNVQFVEGGRSLVPPEKLDSSFGDTMTANGARSKNAGSRHDRLAQRLRSAMNLILLESEALDREYVGLLRSHGHESIGDNLIRFSGPLPAIPITPLTRLCEAFNSIFPDMETKYIERDNILRCRKYDHEYDLSALSDGEKQAFCLLVDVLCDTPRDAFFIVDEPELSLHPRLANLLWDTIERLLPDAVFVYSTHSIGFALRDTVDKLFVLPTSGKSDPLEIDATEIHKLPEQEMAGFLGAVPGILGSRSALVVEGSNSSIDRRFFQWLLADRSLVIAPVGSHEAVVHAIRGQEAWAALSTRMTILGVIERDYRPDDALRKLEQKGCLLLDFHEIESYFCLPELVVRAESKAFRDTELSVPDVEEVILQLADEQKFVTAIRRTLQRLTIPSVSAPSREKISAVRNEAAAKELLETLHNQYEQRDAIADQVDSLYVEELSAVSAAIRDRSIHDLIRMLPGKQCLATIVRRTTFVSNDQIVDASIKNLDPADFPELRRLAEQIRERLP